MLHKEIKTKAQAAKVAKEIAADLMNELEVYDGYVVDVINDDTQYYITVTANDKYSSKIITQSAADTVMKVVQYYDMVYRYINYHLDVKQDKDGKFIPAIVVCFSYK